MVSDRVSESDIEHQILQVLNYSGYFTIKLKDQAEYRNGAYRKGSSYQVRGVSDLLVIFTHKGVPVTIYLEIKTKTGKLSEYQKTFKAKLDKLGHYYRVARTAQEALNIVRHVKTLV